MIKRYFYYLAASLVAFVAVLAVKPTSLVTYYQPDVPKSLQK